MIYYSILLPLLLAMSLSLYIIPRILVVSVRKELYDEATQERRGRKKRNVPRLGGVSLFPILVISVGLPLAYTFMLGDSFDTNGETQEYFVQFMMMLAGLTTMYLVGVMDDLVGVSLHSKLIIEFLAAMLIPLSGLGINNLNGMFGVYELPSWIAFPLTVGAVMYITNTIPMLDDVDGLAAGMSIIAFSVLGSLCFLSEQYLPLLICGSMVGVLAPFMFRNVLGWRVGWRKLFFGSTGGLTIGYLLSYIVITLGQLGGTVLKNGVGMICFGTLLIPMFDVMRVAITRLVNGRNIFRSGDRNHIHHRLMTAGLSPRMVLLVLLLISSGFISLNVIGVSLGVDLSLLLVIDVSVWLVMQVIIMYYKNKGERRHGLRR